MHSDNYVNIIKSLAGLVSNRLCSIPLKHLSENMTRNIKTGSTQMTRYYLIAKRDQTHQRVLLIGSTTFAVEAHKDGCRILQKYTRAWKSEWSEMKAGELHRAADRNNMKFFLQWIKDSVWSTDETTFRVSKSVMAK